MHYFRGYTPENLFLISGLKRTTVVTLHNGYYNNAVGACTYVNGMENGLREGCKSNRVRTGISATPVYFYNATFDRFSKNTCK